MADDDSIDLPFEWLVGDRFLIGSPETVVSQVTAYRRRLGIDRMIFHVRRPGMDWEMVLRGIDLLGREVLPRLAAL